MSVCSVVVAAGGRFNKELEMSQLIKEIQDMRRGLAEKKQKLSRLEGRVDTLAAQLKDKFGTCDEKKLDAMQVKMKTEISDLETSLTEKRDKLKELLEGIDDLDSVS